MKRILVVGETFSNNLGDGIICNVVEKLFNEKFEVELLDLSGKKNYSKKIKVEEFNPKKEKIKQVKSSIVNSLSKLGFKKQNMHITRIKKNLTELFETKYADFKPNYIIFAGGQLFMDYFCEQIEYITKRAEALNIPIIFNACGVGDLSLRNKRCLNRIINSKNTIYISVRDGYEKLKKLDISNKIIQTYDTAILANKYYSKNNNNVKKIGLGIMYVKKYNIKQQISFWTNIIDYCEKNNINWEVFSNGSPEDQKFIQYIFKINSYDTSKIHKRPISPQELVETITSYEKIVSMRMHSLIIAYSYNIPFIGIYWDEKVKKFIDSINSKYKSITLQERAENIFKNLENQIFDEEQKHIILKNINKNIGAIKEKIRDDLK